MHHPSSQGPIGHRPSRSTGGAFWRSLEELVRTPDFQAALAREFPGLGPLAEAVDRRALLRVMGASLALAGLTGCKAEPDETALPYVVQPEGIVSGNPRFYATAVTLAGYALPALGKTYAGRPVKLEGNPDHPAAAGASDPFLQGALLDLYDPERSQAPRHLGQPTSWSAFDDAVAAMARDMDGRQGEGFRILTGAVTSPTLSRQIAALTQRWPKARWHAFEPVNDDLRREATGMAFGRPLETHLLLEEAEVVVSLDDDLLGPGPRQAAHHRRWSARRRAMQAGQGRCRLLVAEPVPTLTGGAAEARLVAPAQRMAAFVEAIAAGLGAEGRPGALSDAERGFVDRAVAALKAHPGRGLLTVGAQHPPEVQAAALLASARLGAIGTTLRLTDPITLAPPDGAQSLERLMSDMADGAVTALVVIGANPAYAAPAGLNFEAALAKVPLRLHAGLHYDETAQACHWHAPLAHELETWSDARAVDGTASIIQPLVRSFYDVRPLHAIMAALSGGSDASDRTAVEATWKASMGEEFDARWRAALVRGFVAGSAPEVVTPSLATAAPTLAPDGEEGGLAVVVRPDPTLWDGRFAHNAWLQETPKPFTKITWGNVVTVSPRWAAENSVVQGDEVRLSVGGRSITGPAFVLPGQEPGTVGLTLGGGRRVAGEVGTGLGYDASALLETARARRLAGASLERTGRALPLASTQLHQAMDGFDFVRTVTGPDQDASTHGQSPGPGTAAPAGGPAPTFYPARRWDSPSWGMAIDTDLCTGCNACVVACVAENNVPVVGKAEVENGREMHWLRVDHYFSGDPAAPRSYFQPVPCMHCEQAPCEMGCPVNATVHSSDGLNLQVYNRCIGTRTCSSFCPYKVRRFNWFDYTSGDPPELRAARNPEVTVRARGVMEKCTYCVQRIGAARINAKEEGRAIREGEVVTACQQACPASAISFGDVTDPGSLVSRHKLSPRNYSLLEEANTRPRTTYLARIEDEGEAPA